MSGDRWVIHKNIQYFKILEESDCILCLPNMDLFYQMFTNVETAI